MSSIVIYMTESKKFAYRTLPLSFEGVWKEGDKIKSEDGSEICTIFKIVPNTKENCSYYSTVIANVNKQDKPVLPKILFRDRPILSKFIKPLQTTIYDPKSISFLNASNLKREDFNIPNIIKCFTYLKVNEQKIDCKVIKMNDTNTLTFDFISKYMESDIETIDIHFSILDKNYSYKIMDNKIILQKNGADYTLKIFHIGYNDILIRLPKYMKEVRKKTN